MNKNLIRPKVKQILKEIKKLKSCFIFIESFKFYPYLYEMTILSENGFGSLIVFQDELPYIEKKLSGMGRRVKWN